MWFIPLVDYRLALASGKTDPSLTRMQYIISKYLENRLRFDGIMAMSLWPYFLGPSCRYNFFNKICKMLDEDDSQTSKKRNAKPVRPRPHNICGRG